MKYIKRKREVDLSKLPKYENGQIDWKKSVGHTVNFIYENPSGDIINGTLEIVGNTGTYKKNRLIVKYGDVVKEIQTTVLAKASLGNILGQFTSDFRFEVGMNIKDERKDIIITEKFRIKGRKSYKFICNKCGWDEGVMDEISLLKGNYCACYVNQIVVENINDIPTTALWMVKFFQGGYDEAKQYMRASNKRIYPICPDCGRVSDRTVLIANLNKTNSIACICSDGRSYPEKFMWSVLNQLNLNLRYRFKADWLIDEDGCKREFDFLLPNHNLIIEVDGGIGHGKKTFRTNKIDEKSLLIDKWKDEQAVKQGYRVIRIPADKSNVEYMKNSIISFLGTEFNLENIDWFKCDEWATKNKVKEICLYYENNKDTSLEELGKIFNHNKNTIKLNLIKGNKFGWCNYEPIDRSCYNGRHGSGKKVVNVFDCETGEFKGCYESVSKLIKQSVIDFGKQFSDSGVRSVLTNHKKQHHGYIFKYEDDNTPIQCIAKNQTGIPKKVVRLDKNEIFIAMYNSISEASRTMDLSITGIIQCCQGKTKTCGGFKWQYAEDYYVKFK